MLALGTRVWQARHGDRVGRSRRGENDMDDRLREALATLGQRIEVAEYERRIAVDEVRELMSRHHNELHLPHVAELTLLPRGALDAMLPSR